MSNLAGDQANILAIFHDTSAARTRDAAVVAAHLELALPYARSDDERTHWVNLATGARRSERLSESRVEAQKQAILAELDGHEETLRAWVRGDWLPPIAVAEPVVAVEKQPAPATRAPAPDGRRLRRSRWRRGRVVVAGLIAALLIAGIAIASTHPASTDDRSAASTPVPTTVPMTPTPSPTEVGPSDEGSQANSECSRLDALDSTIDRLKRRIRTQRRLLARTRAQAAPLEAGIDKIDRDYPSHELPPDVWGRYVPLRDQLKKLDARADRAARVGNRLIRRHNARVRTYNRLVKEC